MVELGNSLSNGGFLGPNLGKHQSDTPYPCLPWAGVQAAQAELQVLRVPREVDQVRQVLERQNGRPQATY